MKISNKVIMIILVVLAFVLILLGINEFIIKPNSGSNLSLNEILENNQIDKDDEAYAGKEMYLRNGDVVIKEENDGETIISPKTIEKTNLVEASEDIKQKYQISDVNASFDGTQTIVRGKVKSNNSNRKDISLKAQFRSSDNRIKGTSNVKLDGIAPKEERNFEITIVGDLTQYKYDVSVEFTN